MKLIVTMMIALCAAGIATASDEAASVRGAPEVGEEEWLVEDLFRLEEPAHEARKGRKGKGKRSPYKPRSGATQYPCLTQGIPSRLMTPAEQETYLRGLCRYYVNVTLCCPPPAVTGNTRQVCVRCGQRKAR